MKKLLLALILLLRNVCFGQVDYGTLKPFVRSFESAFSIPDQWIEDTCSSRIFMLKASVKKGRVYDLSFSDSAPDVFKSLLQEVEGKIETKPLVSWCKENKRRRMDFVFPVFFISPDFPCKQHSSAPKWISDDYTGFGGNQLVGPVFLADPIAIWIPVVHR